MQDKELQLEDTVSADRKERIIYVGPGKTRKISSITSRQNFNNEKFTRKANKGEEEGDEQEEVKESAIQNIGTSQIETGAPTQSDLINKDKKTKSNSPQIEFVTGTEKAGSSSTAIGNAQNMGIKKISEALVKKAITKVKADKNVGTEEIPFDGPYTKTPDVVVDKSGARHTAYSRVRSLARQAMNKQSVKEEVEGIDERIILDKDGNKIGGGSIIDSLKNKPAFNPQHFRDRMNAAGDKAAGDPLKKKYKPAKPNNPPGTVAKSTNEEVELDEAEVKSAKDRAKEIYQSKMRNAKTPAERAEAKEDYEHFMKTTNEEVEQIDELSVGALKNYIKGAKAKLNKEGTEMKTYQEFLDQLLEYTPGPGGVTRVQGRSYGAQYHDPEGDDDADDKPAAKADTPKRGRGRPAGSKSGANQKVTTGKSYGGIATHSLHLPNSK